jgi:uncharacterized protein YjbJ (UPF0337 family)
MVDENRLEDTAMTTGGKVGALTGDAITKAQGTAGEAAGKAREVQRRAVDETKNLVSTMSVAALLSAMGVGFVVGFFVRRR